MLIAAKSSPSTSIATFGTNAATKQADVTHMYSLLRVAVLTLICTVLSVFLYVFLGLPSTTFAAATWATLSIAVGVTTILLLGNRRHHFSVRGLLLGMGLVSLVFGALSISIDRSRRTRVALSAVESLGGICINGYGNRPLLTWVPSLTLDRQMSSVREVVLSNSGATDKDLVVLQSFSDLESLKIADTSITDQGLSQLADTQLQHLEIDRSNVTVGGVIKYFASQGRSCGDALRAIGVRAEERPDGTIRVLSLQGQSLFNEIIGLPELAEVQVLDVSLSEVTDSDIAKLSALSSIEALNIEGTLVTDSGLDHLEPLKKLKSIWARETKVTFSGLKRLFVDLQGRDITEAMAAYGWTTMPGRKLTDTLYCTRDSVRDADLLEIGQLRSLTVLLLDSCYITDAGMKHLAKLNNLQRLYLRHTQVTGQGLVRLRDIKNLERLDLMGSKGVTSEAVGLLPSRESLRALNLLSTAVDKNGFNHIITMPNLGELHINNEDLATLQRALPQLQINPPPIHSW